jgi:lauroyl/myristoyl acyltransferase
VQHVRVAAALDPREDGVRETTSAVTAVVEAFARAEPASWMWLHRRWREPRVSRRRSTFPERTPA